MGTLSPPATAIIRLHVLAVEKALEHAKRAGLDPATLSVVVCQRTGAFSDFDADLVEVYKAVFNPPSPTLPGL